jgi:hypothetical protein
MVCPNDEVSIMRFTMTLKLALAVLTLSFLAISNAPGKDKDDDHQKWHKLGSREVDFKTDHDTIEVGDDKGRYTAVRFKVEDGDLVMQDIKITFGGGQTFEPQVKHDFTEGSRSRDIQLPGENPRIIQKIDFVYHSEHKNDKAKVIVYGLRAEEGKHKD